MTTAHFSGAPPESNNIWMIQLRKPQDFFVDLFLGSYTYSIDVFIYIDLLRLLKSYNKVPRDLISKIRQRRRTSIVRIENLLRKGTGFQ